MHQPVDQKDNKISFFCNQSFLCFNKYMLFFSLKQFFNKCTKSIQCFLGARFQVSQIVVQILYNLDL